MDHAEVSTISKGDVVDVWREGSWVRGTVRGSASGSDPSFWIQFDGHRYETRIYTGMQFVEEYWNQQYKNRKFRRAGLV